MRRMRFHGNRTFLTCQQSIRMSKGSSRVPTENVHSANSRLPAWRKYPEKYETISRNQTPSHPQQLFELKLTGASGCKPLHALRCFIFLTGRRTMILRGGFSKYHLVVGFAN